MRYREKNGEKKAPGNAAGRCESPWEAVVILR